MPHLSRRVNVRHPADTAWEVFLLCFILFPRHYILTLTFGCDKRKALNPTHIHSEFQLLDPNSTPTFQNTTRLLHASWTMPGFKLHAWGFFTFPICSICKANDRATVFLSSARRRCIFPLRVLFFMIFFSLRFLLFSQSCACVGTACETASKLESSLCLSWVQNVTQCWQSLSFYQCDIRCALWRKTAPFSPIKHLLTQMCSFPLEFIFHTSIKCLLVKS